MRANPDNARADPTSIRWNEAMVTSAMLAGVSASLVVATIAGYLLGSLPIANAVARRHGVGDLRTTGDRNPGFWNATRLLGWRSALPILVGDAAKGAVAASIGVAVSDRWWAPYLCGLAAMIGHAWPVFAGFRGGRSVLTFVGTALVVSPLAAGCSVALMFVVWAVGRRFDVAVRLAVASFPAFQLVVDGPVRTAATGVLMTFVGVRFAMAALDGRKPVSHPGTDG
jgi:glycerol-3-phosphate acyltransferase PlsY